MGDYDASSFTCTIGGRVIRQFTGADGFAPGGSSSLNIGPSDTAFGFNDTTGTNHAAGSISVRQTSKDIEYLHELARTKKTVPVRVEVTKGLDKVDNGEVIGFNAASCRIQPASQQFGADSEAQDVTFEVLVIGFDYITKSS